MDTADRVMNELAKDQSNFARDPRFQELKAFYERMLREGIALRKTYDLPMIDTIGRSIRDSFDRRL
jgi:hypothetical protein